MNKKQLVQLLQECQWELTNLSGKCERGERGGWEGSKRRCILDMKLTDTIKLLGYEVN